MGRLLPLTSARRRLHCPLSLIKDLLAWRPMSEVDFTWDRGAVHSIK